MIPTDAEIVERLERVAGWLETTIEKQFLPVVKGMLLEARLETMRQWRWGINECLVYPDWKYSWCQEVQRLERELAALAVEEHHARRYARKTLRLLRGYVSKERGYRSAFGI